MFAETASISGSGSASVTSSPDQATTLAAEARVGGTFDAPALAARLTELGTAQPGFDQTLRTQIEAHLTPVERGELARALEAPANDNAAAPGAGPDPVQLGLDLGQMALDVAGIFDPTPISDGANAVVAAGRAIGSLFSGNWGEAGGHALNGVISAVAIVPVAGDAAKLGKIGKWAETVGDAVSAVAHNPALRETLAPALQKVRDAIGTIPQGALDALPASARESIDATKRQLDEFFTAATKQVPGGGLAAHEAAGGHLIERHVGKSEADLRARLDADPKISGASSFRTLERAETVVGDAIAANRQRIDDWLAGSGTRLVLNHNASASTGISLNRGAADAADVNSVRLVLQRDASMETGYRIVTGYPTAP